MDRKDKAIAFLRRRFEVEELNDIIGAGTDYIDELDQELEIEAAIYLVADKQMSIYDVATLLGFDDTDYVYEACQAHFDYLQDRAINLQMHLSSEYAYRTERRTRDEQD